MMETHDIDPHSNEIAEDLILISIRFYSTMRNIAGVTQMERKIVKNMLLKDLLIDIEQELFIPKKYHLLKADHNSIEAGIICLIDDADIQLNGGLNQKLNKNAKITLISSLHGG